MDWVSLAIPLIAVAVWIFSHLAGQQNETRPPLRPAPRPRNPLDPQASGLPTRPEEDNKYREEMARQRENKNIPTRRPLPQPKQQRPKRPVAGPKPPPLPAILLPSQPAINNQGVTMDALPLTVEPVIKIGQVAAPMEKPKSAAVKNLLELLKKKDSLTTAMLLKEVLDLPLAKRPRRRL
jgi:hypothetical protein